MNTGYVTSFDDFDLFVIRGALKGYKLDDTEFLEKKQIEIKDNKRFD